MPRGNNLKKYAGNKSFVKGKFFELALNELLNKAGFLTDIYSEQLTKNQKRLHGRGATYDPDYLGQFAMGIPFINPLMIVGEAKNYNHQISLAKVREFLGIFTDFSQYVRIDTKKGGEARYSILNTTRFTYCPIYFSVKGFQRSAEGLMFAHGINYISYQNSEVMKKILLLMENVLSQINFSQLVKADFSKFDNLDTIEGLRPELKKRNFNRNLQKFLSYIRKINSLIGVLDFKYPIHILYEKQVTASLFKTVKIIRESENKYSLENTAGRKFGEISLTDNFIKDYVTYANKKQILNRILRQIDIVTKTKNLWGIRQLLIDDSCKESMISRFVQQNQENASEQAAIT